MVALGEAAVPALEALLRARSQTIYHHRYLAADALAAIPGPAATAALTRALRDSIARSLDPASLESEDVIVNRVAEHLGRRAGAEATELLLEALRARRYPQCALALGRIGERRAIPLLIECLHDDAARPAAAEALRGFGEASVAPLSDTLLEPRLGRSLEPPSRIDGRVAAARLLGDLAERGADAARVERTLALALGDWQRAVRVEAALSLLRRARRGAPIPNGESAAELARGGESRTVPAPEEDSGAADAARVLAAALDEPDWSRADTIMQALARFAASSEPLIAALIAAPAADEPDRRRRLRAVELAGRLHARSAVAALASLSDAADAQTRLAAAITLDAIATTDPAAIRRFLDDGEPAVRRRAVEALRRRDALSPDSAVRLLGDPDSAVRALAVACLRGSGPSALPALSRALRTGGAGALAPGSRWRVWWGAWRLLLTTRRGRN